MSPVKPPPGYSVEQMPAFLQPTARQTQIVSAPSDGKAVAQVNADNPNVIQVREPSQFTPGVQTHEETHVFQYGRHPSTVEQMENTMQSGAGRGYDYGGVGGLLKAAQARKTIADYGPEQQAEMVRDYQRKTQEAIAAGDTAKLDQVKAAYGPYIRQLAALPDKNDPMTTIDTHPAAPGLPPSSITGIMEPDPLIGGAARVVAPKGYRLESTGSDKGRKR